MANEFASVGQLVLAHAARDKVASTAMLKAFIDSPVATNFLCALTPELSGAASGTHKFGETMKRHPLERIVRLLACSLTGHRYTVAREFGRARKVACSRCGAAWAMHDDSRSFLPWDSEFEALYAPGGVLEHRGSADSVSANLQPNT